jgi:sulfite exporter TauE/SafE
MTSILEGFLLGLANGASCLSTCAPVLFPYLVSEGKPIRQNLSPLVVFLCGRLTGYLIFAAFAWSIGWIIRTQPHTGLIFGFVHAAIACALIFYGFRPSPQACVADRVGSRILSFAALRPLAMPWLLGLLTGLSLCPPFIAALAEATDQTSLSSSLFFFLSFFLATSLYIFPFPFAGLLGRFQTMRITARLIAGIVGCYYLYRGLILIHGGLTS